MTPEERARLILSNLGITDPAHIDEDINLIVTAFKDAGAAEIARIRDGMTEEEINRSLKVAYDTGFKDGVAAEREACADIADAEASIEGIAQRIAAAIRARKP